MSRERQRLYDAECYGLAEHFLDDYELSKADRAAKADLLASVIQSAIEDWLQGESAPWASRESKAARNAKADSFPQF